MNIIFQRPLGVQAALSYQKTKKMWYLARSFFRQLCHCTQTCCGSKLTYNLYNVAKWCKALGVIEHRLVVPVVYWVMFQICTALGWSGTSWPGDGWLYHRIATCQACRLACHGTCIFTTRRCHGLRSTGQSHFGAHATTTVVSGNLSQPVGWERWTGEAKLYCN